MNQEIAEAIIKWDDHDEVDHFKEVTAKRIVDQSRWSTYYAQVYRDERDGSHWVLNWGRGSPEMQDDGPEDVTFMRVMPVEKVVVDYVPYKEGEDASDA